MATRGLDDIINDEHLNAVRAFVAHLENAPAGHGGEPAGARERTGPSVPPPVAQSGTPARPKGELE
jgi:hypothetical protein